jgi:hypothetical protein
MKLSHVTDKILLIDTKTLATSEREITTKVLHHLKEIDRRRLYSDLKYYSESSAQRRIVACRMLADIPEIEKKLDEGLLTLTNISQVNQFFKDSTVPEKRKILKQVEGLSKKECEKKLFALSGKELPAKDSKKRISEDKIKVAVVLSDETIKVLDKLKALLGKDLSMDELLQFMAMKTIKSVEKDKFKQVGKPRESLPPAKVKRIIPASIKREVYKRDQKCTNCGSTHRLNYDHRHPYALGGPTSVENLRLLCFQCNQRASIKAGFERKFMSPTSNK